MRSWPMTLCQMAVALGAAGFIGGWAGCAMIQGESVVAPDREHDRPLKLRTRMGPPVVHYITARQESLLELLEPSLIIFSTLMLAGGVGLYVMSDAEREKDRLR